MRYLTVLAAAAVIAACRGENHARYDANNSDTATGAVAPEATRDSATRDSANAGVSAPTGQPADTTDTAAKALRARRFDSLTNRGRSGADSGGGR